MGLLNDIVAWLVRRYIERLVCLHFCKFKGAGSGLIYTHVHFLPDNPQRATGLGHDDHTGNDDKGHTTVTVGDECTIGAENAGTLALRQLPYAATAYFHEAAAGGECPNGFGRVRCRCRNAEGEPEDVWVCYTLDHQTFERWYEEQRYPNRTGRIELRFSPVASVEAGQVGPVECGSWVVIQHLRTVNVPSCDGFGGPGDGNNTVVQEARQRVSAAADRITCNGPCAKRTTESFLGWKCWHEPPDRWVAEARVQWRVECEKQ